MFSMSKTFQPQPGDTADVEPLIASGPTCAPPDSDDDRKKFVNQCSKVLWLCFSLATLGLNFALLLLLVTRIRSGKPVVAADVVNNKVITFNMSFNGATAIYDQTPSQSVDDAWAHLFRYALSSVPREKFHFPNHTYPIPGQPDRTVLSLSVLHQLHCLDVARRAMYPEYYPDMVTETEQIHVRHCVSELRQSLMCAADVSPIVWQWSERAQAPKERADIAHSCRDFSLIWDWSKDHAFRGKARKTG
ncbi:hypothetical protein ONZ45_g5325 [Pleurotus djamor]|nr:hypothetical protein ONZ45_g5325 [Pleurotus djamor]